jgi:hypothetical protein
LGASAFNNFTNNIGAEKTFDNTNIVVASDKIGITTHGFGSVNDYINLKYTEGTSAITGLIDGTIYMWTVIHADTVRLRGGGDITDAGAGTGHKLTPKFVYTNSTAVGYNAEPEASNQIMLGDANVTEVKTVGSYTSNSVTAFSYVDLDIDDTEEYELTVADGKAGWGMASLEGEWTFFRFTAAGVVTLVNNTTNVGTTDGTDNKFNIFDAGTTIKFENQLGDNKELNINVWFTP